MYPKLSVKLYGKGVILDAPADGSNLKMQKHQIAKAGQVILSEIWGKKGAIGFVPQEGEGALCTSHFFLFDLRTDRMDPRWLKCIFAANYLERQLDSDAKGTTGYAAVRPDHLLRATIPLPSLEEQRRIIKHLHYLFGKHSEVVQLRRESETKLDDLCRSILFSSHDVVLLEMADVVSFRKPDTEVERHKAYSFAGVYCFGRGVFKGQTKNGTDFAYDRLTKISAGEFIYPKLMAWEGALGAVPVECDGLFVSPEYPVFTINTERVLPEVIDVYYRTPSVWPILAEASTGTNVRRRRLHPTGFLKLRMPVPPMAIQYRIRNARLAFESITRIRCDSESALKAVLPAVLNRAFGGGM
jgi:type I restriction enzyme S subunit